MELSKEFDFDPRSIPQEYLQAIGLITACSAQTESIIEMGIAGCAGVDVEYGLAITTHMSAPLRDGVLRAVAEITISDLDDLDLLDAILDRIKAAFDLRNKYVHNVWLRDPESGKVYFQKTSARGSLSLDVHPVSVAEIREDAQTIYSSGMELMSFLGAKGLLPTFPPDGRSRLHKTKAARKKRRKSLGI